jgi:hypothetical protein
MTTTMMSLFVVLLACVLAAADDTFPTTTGFNFMSQKHDEQPIHEDKTDDDISKTGTTTYQLFSVICTHPRHIKGDLASGFPCGRHVIGYWDEDAKQNEWISVRAYAEWERWLAAAELATPVIHFDAHVTEFAMVPIALPSLKQSEWTQILKLCSREGRVCHLDHLMHEYVMATQECQDCGTPAQRPEAACETCASRMAGLRLICQNPFRNVTALISRDVVYHIRPTAHRPKSPGWGDWH